MNPTRIFGVLAFVTGGGALGSALLLGQEYIAELTDGSFSLLWPMCVLVMMLGSGAIVLSIREEHEAQRHVKGLKNDERCRE